MPQLPHHTPLDTLGNSPIPSFHAWRSRARMSKPVPANPANTSSTILTPESNSLRGLSLCELLGTSAHVTVDVYYDEHPNTAVHWTATLGDKACGPGGLAIPLILRTKIASALAQGDSPIKELHVHVEDA